MENFFNNLKQEYARALAVTTPGLLGPIYFKEVAEIINAGRFLVSKN